MGRLELILGFWGCRREMDMEAENTISIANISFIQMARHRRSSLYGRGIVNFADNYSLRLFQFQDGTQCHSHTIY